MMLVIPSAVLAGILYFRGYPQAFSIGCVPPLLILGIVMLDEGPRWFGPAGSTETKIVILVHFLIIIAAGTASAGVRWLAIWSQQPLGVAKSFPGLPLDMGRTARTSTSESRHPTPDS
jgi:hypothetical protein